MWSQLSFRTVSEACVQRERCLVHSVYQLSEEAAAEDDEGEDNVPSYREWELPSAAFHTVCCTSRNAGSRP
jgi:hypothetical protein